MSRRSAGQWVRRLLLATGLSLLVAIGRPTWASLTAGTILVFVGEAIRLWTAGHLVKTTELITSGPYRFTRNPMYFGRLLLGSGLLIAAWRPGGITLALLATYWAGFLLLYMKRKERVEPARLLKRHGQAYAAYHAAVPALFPRLTPWPMGKRASWSSARAQHNREFLTAAILLGLLVVMAVRIP